MPVEIDYSKTAWGDESVRMHADPPQYLLAACVFDGYPEATIESFNQLRPKGADKLHWRDLGANLQGKSLEVVANTPASTYIVASSPVIGNKQERARRKALERMVFELESIGVTQFVLESRKPALNKKDTDFINHLHQNGTVSEIRVLHIDGRDDLRLWVPDQILGVYGDTKVFGYRDSRWKQNYDKLSKRLEVFEVKL